MKLQELRKQVITRVIVSAVLLVGVGGLAATSFYMRGSYEDNLAKVNNQMRDTNSSIQTTEQYLEQAKKAIESYALMQGTRKASPDGINQAYLTQVLETLKERYVLTELSLKAGEPAIIKDQALAKNNLDIEHVLVTLQFSGLSDELLLSFVDNMLHVLPGYSQVDSLQMERKATLDGKVLGDVMKEKYAPLVQASLSFHWLAIKPKKKEPKPEGNAPNATP